MNCSSKTELFSGPTGSAIEFNLIGSVDIYPNRLTITAAPKPQLVDKSTQRRVVASSASASAVLGLSMTQRSSSPVDHRRYNKYLYDLSSEIKASRINETDYLVNCALYEHGRATPAPSEVWKDEPQAHEDTALGLCIVKPLFIKSST